MKRLFLSILSTICLCLSAAAANATWDADTYAASHKWTAGTTTVGKTAISVSDDVTFNISAYSTAPKYYSGSIRIYKGSTIDIKCASGVKVTKIVFTGESATYTGTPAAVSSGSVSKSGSTLTWTGSTANLTVTCSATEQLRLKSMEVTTTGTATGSGETGSSGNGGQTSTDGSVVYFIAPGYTGHSGVQLTNADGSTTSAGTKASSLFGITHTGKVGSKNAVSFDVSKVTTSYTASYGSLVRWYKGNEITLSPASGYKITRVEIAYSGTSYKGPFTASTGSVDCSGNPLVWTGDATSDLVFTATGQVRFSYMAVTVAATSGSTSSGSGSDKYPALYLRGEFNNWATTDAWKFSTTDGVTYTLKGVTIPAISEFKVASANWTDANWGGVASISPGNYYTLLWDQGNATLDCTLTNATVNFYTDTKSFIVKGTTSSKPKTNTTPTDGWPAGYEGVMLQGFFWDSFTETAWPYLESQANTLSKYFKLIWIPQSAKAAQSPSMGYDPVYWFTNYNSTFGNEASLRSMIKTYKAKGTGFIADVVVNHRSGTTNWTDFPAETWNGVTYKLDHQHICANDEVAWASGQPTPGGNYDTGDNFDGSRDLDHTNVKVQSNCMAYCRFLLEDLGYVGFRYDMVKGYSGYYNKLYNEYSNPTYSVGEYFSDSYNEVSGWIESTGKKSAAFDFPFKFAVNKAFGSGNMKELVWSANGNNQQPAGLIHNWYGQYAVTFVDNHDTYRDGSRFNGNILAANAFMLCSPGTPCVFLPHWQQYTAEIARMIAIRNAVGLSNTSGVNVLRSTSSCYMAEVYGSKGSLVIKVGPEMTSPYGYSDADIRASGPDYCIWSKTEVKDVYTPEYPSKLYLIGNVNGNGWSTSSPVVASSSSKGVYTWNNVAINKASASSANGNFSIVSATGSNWDIVNQSHRYGATDPDKVVTSTAGIKIFPGKVTASGATSWTAAAGNYKVVADLNTMTLTLTPVGAAASGQETAVFIAPDCTSATGVKLYNSDGKASGSSTVNLLNVAYTAKDSKNKALVTFESTGGGSSKMGAYGALVRWYKGNVMTLTPAAGKAIVRVEVAYTGASYGGPFTANSGSVNASDNPVVWTGNTASPLRLTATGQMRFSYVAVTLAEADANSTQPATGTVWMPVKSKSDLVVGDRYIIVSASASKAAGKDLSGGTSGWLNAVGVDIESDGDILTVPADAMILTLDQGTTSSYYSLKYNVDGSDYYLAVPSTSTSLSRTASKSTSNNVQIGVSTSNNTFTYVKNNRRLNYGTANNGCFQAYSGSSSSKIRLYREVAAFNRVHDSSSRVKVSFVAPADEENDGVKLHNSDGTDVATGTGPSAATLKGVSFTAQNDDEDVATFECTHASGSYSGVYGDHVRWYKNNQITITPADGYRLVNIDVEVLKSYAGPFSASDGDVFTSDGLIEWTGSTVDPLVLTADAQIRFTAMHVVLRRIDDEISLPMLPDETKHHAYLQNDAGWATPHAYVWTQEAIVPWPGTAMVYDADADLWVYEFDADAAPGYIIFNDGVNNSGNQTEDLDFIEDGIYSNGYDEDLTAIYLVGPFNHWSFQDAYKFSTEDGIFYTFDIDHIDAGTEFKVASRVYNPVNLGGALNVKSAEWTNLVPGTMQNCSFNDEVNEARMTVDLDNNRMHLGENFTTGIHAIDADKLPARYFDLTGREVRHPKAGLYIVVRGNKVTKEIIR